MQELQKLLDVFWEEWTAVEKLGEGTFGKVYKIRREFLGREQFAALKVISVSQNKTGCGYSFSMDDRSFVEEIVSEIELMAKFKGNSNIVSYEDHMVVEESDGSGWTILIRMELLTPLSVYIKQNEITDETVTKIGSDISKALDILSKNSIIHRDVKLENIFISQNGDFKLGDFGTARIIEKTVDNRTKTGTYMYMAPEVIRSEPYGAQADIYSLGILMYYMLNDFRFPFYPPYPEPVKYDDTRTAFNKRISGEAMTPPKCENKKLASIVLKACEFRSENRFANAREMNVALNSTENIPTPPPLSSPPPVSSEPPKPKFVKPLLIIGLIVAVVAVCGIGIKVFSDKKKPSPVQNEPSVTTSQTERQLSEKEQDLEDKIIDVLMNGYDFNSLYLHRDTEGGEKLYYTFLDMDFDGIPELIVNRDNPSFEMMSCEINKFDFENKALIYVSGESIYDNDLSDIMLFGKKNSDEKPFYLFEEKTHFMGEIWYKINKIECDGNGITSTPMLDFSIYANEDAEYGEFNAEDYDNTLNGQKEKLCQKLLEDHSDLNLNYKVIDGQEFNDMSGKDKESALREAYRMFSYDGITTEG